MKCAILMVTYKRDLAFAEFSFQTVQKFASGFSERVVVVPNEDVEAFRPIAEPCGFRVVGFAERAGKGMLHHQVMILQADEICPDSDAILHMDADCMFTGPVTPETYMFDGKPEVYRQRYEDFRHQDTRYSWRKCVRNAVGFEPEYETMLRHPSLYLRNVYSVVRQLIGEHTQMDWEEYVLSCRNEYPQTFAEFPTLGAVAIRFFADQYHWVTLEKEGFRPHYRDAFMTSLWSHGGLEMINDRHPGRTARQVIEEILK